MNASRVTLRQDRRRADARDATVAAHHGLDRALESQAGHRRAAGHCRRPWYQRRGQREQRSTHGKQCRLQDIERIDPRGIGPADAEAKAVRG